MTEIILSILSSGVLTGIITHFFTRRKERASAEKSELDNTEHAVRIWRELAEGMNKELQSYREQLKEATEQLVEAVAQVKHLEREMEKLTEELKKR